MRLLWIATKPPAPPVDGGRLVALLTLQALARQGVEITLVAPIPPGTQTAQIEAVLAPLCRPRLVEASPRRRLACALGSLAGGPPVSIARHSSREVRAEVGRLLTSHRFQAVHAEQLQAFAQAQPGLAAGVPVVLRAQNVESDLWLATSKQRCWAGPCLAREARRLAAYEARVVRRAAAVLALTEHDAARLRELAGSEHVGTLPPAFPSDLPPADRPLPGSPPVVLLGSGGWLPNREGASWFVNEVWPEARKGSPGAVLHLFTGASDRPKSGTEGIVLHPPPAESREAFAPGSILVVPLRIASGIRMKILEAWARGVPVVATPEAAMGAPAKDRGNLLLATESAAFSRAIAELAGDAELWSRLVRNGREALRKCFDPGSIAERLLAVYRGHPPTR